MKILIICKGNAIGSPMVESLLNHKGAQRLTALSAGTEPKKRIRREVAEYLIRRGHDPRVGTCTHWRDVDLSDGDFDVVINFCEIEGDVSPELIGKAMLVDWSDLVPAGLTCQAKLAKDEISALYSAFDRRVEALLSLPFEYLDRATLRPALARALSV
ncbi:arsenate-mycothiol transferase ArsC [Oceanomicrobium pacificus]|uniref:Phosphotyrosine protein phosphatase I domain-containing protein n=1 Tax=Oceanomicrobium pacificus TaxID=2692916 RepID=A0A6B0TPK9_9RHOB|nr:hypothetical protein [Oceanomicrobium pacificus]MXU65846.1 hypothetical protein [Oceanomicrobium pacificus]